MTEFDSDKFVKDFCAAWDNHDADAVADMFTDDVVFEASFGPEVYGERAVGKEASKQLAASK